MTEFKTWSGFKNTEWLAKHHKSKHRAVRAIAEYHDRTEYDKNRLVIGVTSDGDAFELSMRKSIRALAIASMGSGKTVLEQNFMSRFYAGGNLCTVPSDIKGVEYQNCSKPLQPHYRKFLLKYPYAKPVDEQAIAMPMKVYRPFFFSHFVDRSFPKQYSCQFRLHNMNMNDFIGISGVEEKEPLSTLQKVALEKVFRKIKDGDIVDLAKMRDYLQSQPEIGRMTARVLIAAAYQMEQQDVIGTQFDIPNFTEDLLQRRIPVLNTYGAQFSGKRTNPHASAYVAMIIRNLYDAKASGRISGHLLTILDEIPRFCPNGGNPSSKSAIIDFYRLSRSERISIFASCQDFRDIPDQLIEMATHIFVPGTGMDAKVIREIMLRFAPWEQDSIQAMNESIGFRLRKMPTHSWFCINKPKKQTIIFKPAMPLCFHKSES
jgi:hypothetical protein